jgi:Raf kinase inhibitor-like YbhB/YbcL family protein
MLEKLPESVGHALINQRAGMDHVVYNQLFRLRATARLDVRSAAFTFNAQLPVRFTADGDGLSPPLAWEGVPAGTESVALIVEDADSPTPHPLVHAIVVNLGNSDGGIEEGALDSPDHVGVGLAVGTNSFFKRAWLPPDPPRGHGVHRYVFQVFALGRPAESGGGADLKTAASGRAHDTPTDTAAPGRRAFIEMVLERAVAVGCLIGTYERAQRVSSDKPEAAAAAEQDRVWVTKPSAIQAM